MDETNHVECQNMKDITKELSENFSVRSNILLLWVYKIYSSPMSTYMVPGISLNLSHLMLIARLSMATALFVES